MHLNDRILAVDDNPDNLAILEELLGSNYNVLIAQSGEEALQLAPTFRPDLVLLDIMMPGLDGLETCVRLCEMPDLQGCRVVMLSAKNELHDRLLAYSLGAVDYIAKPFDHHEVRSKVRVWMQMVRHREVENVWREVEEAHLAIGDTMLSLASFRDNETAEHLFRVRWYAQSITEMLSLSGPYARAIDERFQENLYRAVPLHDIGKIGIEDAILRKPGPLTTDEFEIMKRHTVIGSQLLEKAADRMPHARYLEMASIVARCHHERFDGKGYPAGLAGTEIPLAARICAVADVFDALTSDRVYRPAMSFDKATGIIKKGSGSQFDPVIVDAFLSRSDDLKIAYTRFHEADRRGLAGESTYIRSTDSVLPPATLQLSR